MVKNRRAIKLEKLQQQEQDQQQDQQNSKSSNSPTTTTENNNGDNNSNDTNDNKNEQVLENDIQWKANGDFFTFYLDGSQENFHTFIDEYLKSTDATRTVVTPTGYDSDEDLEQEESSDQFVDLFSTTESPVPAFRTTINCSDGTIKGNELLMEVRNCLTKLLPKICSEVNDDAYIKTEPGKYFAGCLGQFAKFKSTIEVPGPYEAGEYSFGKSGVKVELNKDERMIIVDKKLRDWITKDLRMNMARLDLPYRGYTNSKGKTFIGIDSILAKIRRSVQIIGAKSSNQGEFISDRELATLQLHCAFPEQYPITDSLQKTLCQGALHKFLDFFNALIFGIEASRSNVVLLTGLMALRSVKEGKSSFNNFFDIFPMSVTRTGTGNFILEKALLIATKMAQENDDALKATNQKKVDFSFMRSNPDWAAVTLRTVILLKSVASQIDSQVTRQDFFSKYLKLLKDLFKDHYTKKDEAGADDNS